MPGVPLRATLHEVLDAFNKARVSVMNAKACISQNRGFEREQARSGYEHAVDEELLPAMTQLLEHVSGEIEADDVMRISRLISQILDKRGVR